MARVEAKLDALKDTLTANNQALVDQIKTLFGQQPQPPMAAPPLPVVQVQAPEEIPELQEGKWCFSVVDNEVNIVSLLIFRIPSSRLRAFAS